MALELTETIQNVQNLKNSLERTIRSFYNFNFNFRVGYVSSHVRVISLIKTTCSYNKYNTYGVHRII